MSLSDPYEGFSKVFDKVVSSSKYNKWEAWIRSVWNKHNVAPKSLLDLACGTGINSIRFSKNMEVVGIDSSASMLAEARKKDKNIPFLHGHFLNFKIPKKTDTAICLDFSINYILRVDEFVEFLNRVYSSLNDEGIFIFDFKPVNTFVKSEKHLQNEEFDYYWKCNTENNPFVIIDIHITLKNTGETFNEIHIERGYSLEEIKEIVDASKFDLLDVYYDCEKEELANSSGRIHIVLKK